MDPNRRPMGQQQPPTEDTSEGYSWGAASGMSEQPQQQLEAMEEALKMQQQQQQQMGLQQASLDHGQPQQPWSSSEGPPQASNAFQVTQQQQQQPHFNMQGYPGGFAPSFGQRQPFQQPLMMGGGMPDGSAVNNTNDFNSSSFAMNAATAGNNSTAQSTTAGLDTPDPGLQQRYQNMLLQQLLLQQQQELSPMMQMQSLLALGMGNNSSTSNMQLALLQQQQQHQQQQQMMGLGTSSSSKAAQPLVHRASGKRKAKKRRDKSRPSQPLSAYNLFFKDQRLLLLAEQQQAQAKADQEDNDDQDGGDADATNGKRKRPKIGFERMAKTIAKRWKAIDKEDLVVYEKRAQEDQKRYKAELAVYLQKKRDETATSG